MNAPNSDAQLPRSSSAATKVLLALATAAALAAGATVVRTPVIARDVDALHADLARVESKLDRIESLLLERK